MVDYNNGSDVDGRANHFNVLFPSLTDGSQSRYFDFDSFNEHCGSSPNDISCNTF